MLFKSPHPNVKIPNIDILTWLFESPDAPLSDVPIFWDTVNPEQKNVSMRQYRALVQRLAKGIQTKLRLKPQDKALVFSGNNVYFPSLLLGIVGAECVFTGANPTFTARELAYQIKDAGAKICFVTPTAVPIALDAANSIGFNTKAIYVFDDDLENTRKQEWGKLPIGGHWTEILTEKADFRWRQLNTAEEVNATAAINYSSGTTGVPKGVEISHRNFIANTIQTIATDANVERDYDPVNLAAIPMYHAYGMNTFVLQSPKLGRPVYVMPRFDFIEYIKCIEKYKITSLSAVPPIVVAFAKHPAVKKTDLSSVRAVGSGAAPLGAETAIAAEANLKNVDRIRQGYGLSEVTCAVITQTDGDNGKRGTVGHLTPNCEAKLIDDSGNELGRNQTGELYVRGPNVMKGYYNRPEATAETITPDGWLKTGDMAYVDDNDFFYIVDRKKELIKTSAYQVAPAELEAVLLEHPGVADAGVIGIKYAENERPRAYLVKNPGSDVTTEDIMKYMTKSVAKYKQLTGGIVWVDAIPKNPSGKILRKLLRERAAKEVIDSGDHKAKL